jgi:thioredoxin reductase
MGLEPLVDRRGDRTDDADAGSEHGEHDARPGDAVDKDCAGFVRTGAGAATIETSLPGVFAIGDARLGSTKRVDAAVGEGAAVVAQIHALRNAGVTAAAPA